MIINNLTDNIIYIEDAIPNYKEIVDALNSTDGDPVISPVIYPWDKWIDHSHDDIRGYGQVHRGYIKTVDWDGWIANSAEEWFDKKITPDHSPAHTEAFKIVKMIEEPLLKVIDIWAEKTNNPVPDFITRNYSVYTYRQGGHVGRHIDIDPTNPSHTMDWTILIYLSDDYEGGNINFPDQKIRFRPAAGSALCFRTIEPHIAEEVIDGDKYFCFFYIHTEYGLCLSSYDQFWHIVNQVKKSQ